MAKTAEQFLNDLAQANLVPGEILESLRRQVAKAAKPVAPQTLAKLLIDKGHLTAKQGQQLLGAAPAAAVAPAKSAPAPLPPLPQQDMLAPLDDLSMMPLDDLLTPAPAPAAKPAAAPAKPAAPAKAAIAPPKPAAAVKPAPKPAAPAALDELE